MAGNQTAGLGNSPGNRCELKGKPATSPQRHKILYGWQEERKGDLAKLEEAGKKTRASLSTMFVWC